MFQPASQAVTLRPQNAGVAPVQSPAGAQLRFARRNSRCLRFQLEHHIAGGCERRLGRILDIRV